MARSQARRNLNAQASSADSSARGETSCLACWLGWGEMGETSVVSGAREGETVGIPAPAQSTCPAAETTLRPWLAVKRFPGGGCRRPSRSSPGPLSVFLRVHCAVPAHRARSSGLMICWSPCVRDTCPVVRSRGRRLAGWPLRCHLALSKWPGDYWAGQGGSSASCGEPLGRAG